MHIDMCLLQTCSLSYESHQFHLVVHHLRYLVLLWSPSSCLYIVGSIFICEGCLSRNMSMLSRRAVSDIAAWLYIRCLVFAYVVCVAHHEKAKRHEPPCSSCCSFLYARIYMICSLDIAPLFSFLCRTTLSGKWWTCVYAVNMKEYRQRFWANSCEVRT